MQNRPTIGITMGDAAGVGPEIIVKALTDTQLYERANPVVIGDAKILQRAVNVTHEEIDIHPITKVSDAKFVPGTIDCIDLDVIPADLLFGRISPVAGDGAFQFIHKAVELGINGDIQAICTAPLNKEALHKGGHHYPGHTELLAELTDTKDFAMMLTAPTLRVIHVTTHVGLIEAVHRINPERVYKVIKMAYITLQRAGITDPKIAVCGVNPHAGENGLFGNGEEEDKIIPGVARAQEEGIQVQGPLPADTLFYRATRGDFDIVVAMYHDQGHAPIKVLGLESGVNITVGLPIIRTSVDHGTAFDIAGKGIADPKSLLEAMNQAVMLAPKSS